MSAIPWKTIQSVHYTRTLKNPNRFGNRESACVRKETFWSVRLPSGQVMTGFASRRDAAMAAKNFRPA